MVDKLGALPRVLSLYPFRVSGVDRVVRVVRIMRAIPVIGSIGLYQG